MSRWKAAGIHLSISLIVATLVGSLIYFVWYPPPYFTVAGGSKLMLLIMSVDVVIGPLLTLAVFRTGKKGLKFDLTVITLLQLSAFCYGFNVITGVRPVFIVAQLDRFVPVSANQLDDVDLAQASRPEFATRSWTGPRLAAAIMPTDLKEADAILSSGLRGKDIDKYPKYYVPYPQAADDLLKRAHPLAELIKKQPQQAEQIQGFIDSSGENPSDLVYLPLEGRVDSYTMVLSRRTKQPLTALAVDPW